MQIAGKASSRKETAGAMTTGKWRQPDVPHRGWTCVDVEDLGEPEAVCEMCEVQEIRFAHHMEHQDYPTTLRCGCICAGHMEQDHARAQDRDAAMRARAKRKDKWLDRKWRTSTAGNAYLNDGGYNVVVFQRGEVWGFRVLNRETDDELIARKPYLTEDAAMLRAFDAIEWMRSRGR
jgi:hypothetical protein